MIVPAKQDQGSEDQASHSRQPLVHPNNTAHTLCPLIYMCKRGKVVMLLKLLSELVLLTPLSLVRITMPSKRVQAYPM